MSSFRSKIIIWMIRNRHLFQGRLRPEVVDDSFSVEKFRAHVDSASAKVKLPADVGVQAVRIGGMYAEWIAPQNPSPDKVLLYIHGGGFISGSCLTHRMHVARFARECGLRSLLFDYRLAPEHPFPAATEDCVTAYKWLLEQGIAPHNIVVGGESAGATLTLSLLLALKEQQIDLPRAAFVISPVTDLRCGAASFTYNAPHDVAPMGSWTVWTNMYIAGNDPTTPLLSPLFGDFRGIPPLYVCVGTHEIHYDDCLALARVARDHGVDVTLREWDRMVHAFPLLPPIFSEAKAAFAEICTFVKNI
jgi:acetyl esterase/lipase